MSVFGTVLYEDMFGGMILENIVFLGESRHAPVEEEAMSFFR